MTCTAHVFDPLTGLYNRREFQRRLIEEYNRAKSLACPLSILALDLDRFREINMKFLLPTGDQVLVEVGRLVQSAARPGDVVVRDGGDQFSVILPDTNGEQACQEAERIRDVIASAPIRSATPWFSGELSVTVSVGVATLTPEVTEAWDLFVRARNAVHEAKRAGRNRVVLASEPLQ